MLPIDGPFGRLLLAGLRRSAFGAKVSSCDFIDPVNRRELTHEVDVARSAPSSGIVRWWSWS